MKEDDDEFAISGAELTMLARAAGALRRVFRRPDPVAVLNRRKAVKHDITAKLQWPERDPSPEVVVVKLGAHDRYPDTDLRIIGFGASDWFKTEVKELHDRGLEVFASIEWVRIRNGKAWRVTSDEDPAIRTVYVVGRIPYERISFVDWSPDPAYGGPRFYVAYSWRRNPYRETVLYEKQSPDYLRELHGVKYKGAGGGPVKRSRRLIRRVRFNLDARRQDRRHRRAQ